MLSELLAEDKRRIFELEQQLAEYEKGNKSVHASDISLGLEEMGKRLSELEKQANSESKGRRDDMRRRVAHLRSTHTHIRQSLEVFVRRRDQQKYEKEKRELFGVGGGDGDRSSAGVNIDLEMAERDSLHRSSQMVGEYLAHGQETLNELLDQKARLKGIQRKVFDIMNYLGVSQSIIKAVEKRDLTDKWIVLSGMVIVTTFTIGLWWFIKR